MLWEGAVTKIGVPSDGVPGGGTVCTVWEREAIEASMSTMVNMPLNCEWDDGWFSNPAFALTGHDERFVIGAVNKVWIDGDYLMCSGIIWKDNFPDVAYMIQNAKGALGFSVETYPLEKCMGDDGFEHITSLEFTGLCVCWSEVAAYTDTFITQLVATRQKTKEIDNDMNEEQLKAMFAEFSKGITEEISKVQASVDQRFAEEAKKTEELEAAKKLEATKQVEAEAVIKLEAANKELADKLAKLQASIIPGPTATQAAAPKDGEGYDAMAELDKINKMTCSVDEKIRLRFMVAANAQ